MKYGYYNSGREIIHDVCMGCEHGMKESRASYGVGKRDPSWSPTRITPLTMSFRTIVVCCSLTTSKKCPYELERLVKKGSDLNDLKDKMEK